MDQTALVTEETDAGRALIRELHRYLPVKVAFWVKETEEGQWDLYIASDQIDDKSVDSAYGEVLRLAGRSPSPYLDPFQVKMVPSNDPLAKAAIDLIRRFPGTLATRIDGTRFGGRRVDGAFIYPASVVQ